MGEGILHVGAEPSGCPLWASSLPGHAGGALGAERLSILLGLSDGFPHRRVLERPSGWQNFLPLSLLFCTYIEKRREAGHHFFLLEKWNQNPLQHLPD